MRPGTWDSGTWLSGVMFNVLVRAKKTDPPNDGWLNFLIIGIAGSVDATEWLMNMEREGSGANNPLLYKTGSENL